jgi:transcriptional regulator with XRE-family HTH domain
MTSLNSNTSLGHRIKAQRLNMGMTQEQLAEVMCVPKSTISAYENDKVDIKSSVIVELSKKLNTTPDYLLGMKEDRNVTEIVSLISKIKTDKILEILIIQVRALAEL